MAVLFLLKQNFRTTFKNCCSGFLSSDYTQHLFPVDYIVIIIVTGEKKSSLYNFKTHLHTESINFPGSWSNLWKKGAREEKKEKKISEVKWAT